MATDERPKLLCLILNKNEVNTCEMPLPWVKVEESDCVKYLTTLYGTLYSAPSGHRSIGKFVVQVLQLSLFFSLPIYLIMMILITNLTASPSPHNSLNVQSTSQHVSPQKRLIFTQEAYWNQSITLRSILNAVVLDEWIKELAALCEEHALRLSADNYEDDTYIRMVALWLRAKTRSGRTHYTTHVSERSLDTFV